MLSNANPNGGKGKPHTHTLLIEDMSFMNRFSSDVFCEIFKSVSSFFPQINVNKALLFVKSRYVK